MRIENAEIHARFVRLLQNANIDVEETHSTSAALSALAEKMHAVLFTDQLDLVRTAPQLPDGAATHIVFVGAESDHANAWPAGANDCVPEMPGGASFWTHLTTARRMVTFAAALKIALTDNRALSTVDGLTGCGSRRFFDDEFPREVERAVCLGKPISLVMCDVDLFKQVNDEHGHPVGDDVLVEFANRLNGALRLGSDWCARVGGEEFAVVLPDTPHVEGLVIANRLRSLIADRLFDTRVGALRVTASFGVCGTQDWRATAVEASRELIRCADSALYRSKHGGRNRVLGHQPEAS